MRRGASGGGAESVLMSMWRFPTRRLRTETTFTGIGSRLDVHEALRARELSERRNRPAAIWTRDLPIMGRICTGRRETDQSVKFSLSG